VNKRKFCLTLTNKEIAGLTAKLLNSGGQFGYIHRDYHILRSKVVYYIELDYNKVIGVIGIEYKTPDLSEIKHICVHKDCRNRGLGKKLLQKAVNSVQTPLMYGVIREDNYPSIHNVLELEFKPIATCNGISNKLIIFGKKRRY